MVEFELQLANRLFKMIYYSKLIESRKIKKSFLKKLYNFSYTFTIIICYMCAGVLVQKNSLISIIGFIICLICGSILLAIVKMNSEWSTDFEEYLEKATESEINT